MKKRKFTLFILTILFIAPTGFLDVSDAAVDQYFSIDLLTPNTEAERIQFSQLIESLLPEIGITVDTNDFTGWGDIGPRTWSYPLLDFDYIPTYKEGGYDILFVRNFIDFSWNPTGYFDSDSQIPIGDNFYQYNNPSYDSLLESYLTELNPSLKTSYAYQLQEIIYEDLPNIVLYYPMGQFGERENVIGVDELLLAMATPRYEYWDDSSDDIVKFAMPYDYGSSYMGWNPFYSAGYVEKLWMEAVYGSLYKRAQNTREWVPQIAAGMASTTNGLDITVEIDSDAMFSDGSFVLAEDIEYTYELYIAPDLYSDARWDLNPYFEGNDSITAVDTRTVTFNLSQEHPDYYKLLSYEIIDKSEVEPAINNYGLSIFTEVPFTGNVGGTLVKSCGPFVLTSLNPYLSKADLVPNIFYADMVLRKHPYLSELHFEYVSSKSSALTKLSAGDVDIIDSMFEPSIDDLNITGVKAKNFTYTSYQEMAINMRHPYLGTGELTPVGNAEAAKYVRKAISHLIPRDQIINDTLGKLGIPGVTFCSPVHHVFDDSLQPYEYNITLAREYMKMAGFGVITTPTPTKTGNTLISIILIVSIGLTVLTKLRKIRK